MACNGWILRGQGLQLWPRVIDGPGFEDEEEIRVVAVDALLSDRTILSVTESLGLVRIYEDEAGDHVRQIIEAAIAAALPGT